MVQEVLKLLLESEFSRFPGAEPHQRIGCRCGFYEVELVTKVGSIPSRVPRNRKGEFPIELFERYQRSEKAFVLALMQMYVQGVATRKVRSGIRLS